MAESSEDDADFASVESDLLMEDQELPPLDDRTCFLTCLACILTSSYKYDVMEEEETEQVQIKEDEANNDDVDDDDDDAGEDYEDTVDNDNTNNDSQHKSNNNKPRRQFSDAASNSSDDDVDISGAANDVSMFLEEEEEEEAVTGRSVGGRGDLGVDDVNEEDDDDDDDDDDAQDKDDKTKNNNPSSNVADGGGPRRRWRPRFGRNSKTESTTNSNTTASDDPKSSTTTMSSSVSSTAGNRSRQRLNQKQRRKRLSKAQKKLQLAAQRHYNRRFIVADQLLQSSCDQLLLDKELSGPLYEELKPRLEALKTPLIIPKGSNLENQTRGLMRKRWTSMGSQSNDGSNSSSSDGGDKENTNNISGSGSDNDIEPNTDGTDTHTDKDPRSKQMQQQYLKQQEWMTECDDQLAEFLPRLSPGSGYRCLCWLLFQNLINASKRGYDARVRYAFKSLAVAVLIQDIERTLNYTGDDYLGWKVKNYTTWVSFATRKFEQVEAVLADRLLKLARQSSEIQNDPYATDMGQSEAVSLEELDEAQDQIQVVTVKKNKKKLVGAKKHLVRGLKIGGVGVVAGTLLAITGGMAAPAIAGALTFLGMGAVAGTFLTLASTTAVVHIFGVAGGSLAAYKMRRRTAGLTEFTIVQSLTTASKQNEDNSESSNNDLLPGENEPKKAHQPRLARWREKAKAFKDNRVNQIKSQENLDETPSNVELSRTMCISGWLTDKSDFQRSWGLTPTKPPLSKLEKLQRFYKVYNPDLIPMCDNLLKRWKKEMTTFWELLEDKYGCNPDTLFPLRFGPMHDAALTEVEVLVLDKLILEIGEARGKQKQKQNADLPIHVQSAIASEQSSGFLEPSDKTGMGAVGNKSAVGRETIDAGQNDEEGDSNRFRRQCYASVFEQVAPSSSLGKLIPPDHLATVWDFSSRYGGEIYTLHWESQMLMKLCTCFRDVALQATASAGQQALRLMVANTLALAASVPIYIVQAMNAIDETWAVVVSRAEDAGKELARSLLINNAGHRPVTLLAYSFGARVVFSCLKQLAVYQQQWEEYHEQIHSRAIGFAHHEEEGKSPNRKEKKWMLHELEFEREPASVVEDVILMGAPMYLSLSSWKACRQVIAGRFVNVYSRTDRILSLMFKYKQLMESFKPVCGNCTVAVPGVENIDISDLVNNHQEYVLKVGDILKRVRHGQPIRSSTNALDEVALIAEAKTLAKQQQKTSAEAAVAPEVKENESLQNGQVT